eukprot:NODE_46_length_32145_cov_0.918711.p16 type:complete len:270 gc:universal NODE_46_length_32145_cov_0.918711:30152-29343(-)
MSNPFEVLTAEELKSAPVNKAAPQQTGKRDYPTRGVARGISIAPSSSRGDAKKTGRGGSKRPGKREFDRHSGMDRKDSHKKDVAGKGTWGDPTKVVELSEEEEAEAQEEEEEVANVKTMDEYLKEKAEKDLKIGVDTIPEARRTVDSNWKGAKVLKKEEDDPTLAALMNGKSKSKKSKDKEQNKKVYLDIAQQIIEPESSSSNSGKETRGRGRGSRAGARGSRGRGDRGAPRGRGDRGSDSRGSRGPSRGVKRGGKLQVQNEKEFPALA